MGVRKQYRSEGKNENRQTHQQDIWRRGSRAGATEDDPENCSSGKSQRLTNWGENDAIDFQKTNCQIFSTTDFEQAYERAAAEEKRKFATAAGGLKPANIGNHKS